MSIVLILYCVAVALSSWVGGGIPTRARLGHRQTQLVLSLVSGVMLGVAMLHLFPQSMRMLENESQSLSIGLGGLLFMFLMIRMFPFHHHDAPRHDEDHECEHPEHDHEIRRADVSWLGLAVGFSAHTVIDGVALAAATLGGSGEASGLAGLGVFIAIFLHKPLDAMTITSLMAVRDWPLPTRRLVNAGFALMCPLGAAAFALGFGATGGDNRFLFGAVLAFAAGVFLCISLSDLLPEVQFHSHDRLAMSGALLLGVTIAAVLEVLPV